MKKRISLILPGSVGLMFTVAPALAASKDDPGIQKREVNQQRRIDQGIESWQITPKEAGNLDATGKPRSNRTKHG